MLALSSRKVNGKEGSKFSLKTSSKLDGRCLLTSHPAKPLPLAREVHGARVIEDSESIKKA